MQRASGHSWMAATKLWPVGEGVSAMSIAVVRSVLWCDRGQMARSEDGLPILFID
jgi:hypothetical protein